MSMKGNTWCLSTRTHKSPLSAPVQGPSRYWTRGVDTWIGVWLVISPKWIGCILPESAFQPAEVFPVCPVEVQAQMLCRQELTGCWPWSFASPLTLQRTPVPLSLGHHACAWYSPPAQNPEAACMLTDTENATALFIARGKNLRIHWVPREDRHAHKSIGIVGKFGWQVGGLAS